MKKKNEAKKKTVRSKKRSTVLSEKVKKDSIVMPGDVKYRVSFLAPQMFRGVWYKKGDSIELPENDAKAYIKRTMLKIERV